MRIKARAVALLAVSAVLAGCATRPENVAATHVSHSRYSDRTCKSLSIELEDVQGALRAQSAKLGDKATQDAVVTGVGVLLFWPALFALGNNGALEGDVARLKGEEQAVRRQMREANCDAIPAPVAPNPPATPAVQSVAQDSGGLPTSARRGEGGMQ